MFHFLRAKKLPPAPAGQHWIIFEDKRVAFLAPIDFKLHREPEDTVAIYPPGESGITLRFSLHPQILKSKLPPNAAEQFVIEHATERGLALAHRTDRVYLTEVSETDWPDRRVLVHHWQIGVGRILVVATATVWGPNREAEMIQSTLRMIPQIIDSIRLV